MGNKTIEVINESMLYGIKELKGAIDEICKLEPILNENGIYITLTNTPNEN